MLRKWQLQGADLFCPLAIWYLTGLTRGKWFACGLGTQPNRGVGISSEHCHFSSVQVSDVPARNAMHTRQYIPCHQTFKSIVKSAPLEHSMGNCNSSRLKIRRNKVFLSQRHRRPADFSAIFGAHAIQVAISYPLAPHRYYVLRSSQQQYRQNLAISLA